MNRKQLTLLVILLVILGAAGLFIQSSRNKGSESGETGTGQKLLGSNFPVNDVTHITLKGATNELNLVKKDDTWRVRERGNYPASFAQISEFLIKAAGLKVVQSEEIGASQLARMELTAPGQGTNSGVLLELKGKDEKTMKSVLLGKKHFHKLPEEQAARFGEEGMPDGRYVMTEGDKGHALLVGDALSSAEPKAAGWLNKDFFKIEKPRSISVTYPAASTNSWILSHDTEAGEWKLSDAKKDEKLDTSKTTGVTSPFASPSFNDVLVPPGKPEDHGLDKPTLVTIVTFDNLIYTIKIGSKSGEDYPVNIMVSANFPKERVVAKDEKPEQKAIADKGWQEQLKRWQDKLKHEQTFQNWTYLMPVWNVDPVLKERKELLVEKKDESKKDEKSSATDEKKDDLNPADLLGSRVPDKKP
jgi:hypothetical protein